MTNTANTTKTVRFTKAMRFADIAAMIQGQDAPNGSSVDDVLAFIKHETDLLAKKNSTDGKKLTATQEANAKYRALIVNFLNTQTEPRTCTEIAKSIVELSDFNNQKVASLLKRLIDDGQVVKTSGKKGQSLFVMA